jgi:hypothetical protein
MGEINEEKFKKEMKVGKDEVFTMGSEEMETAKSGSFNPFWSTKDMKPNTPYKFRVLSDKIVVREIQDNFAGRPTPRMIIAIESLEDNNVYDLVSYKDKNKEGNYSSLTLAIRKLYALCNGNVKDVMFSLIKRTYTHEKYGETDGYNINILRPGE